MARARILVADDHTLIVDAFKKLLEPEFEVVATVSDGRALLRTAYESKPDIAIIDLGMPLLNGADAGQELKKLLPQIKLLVVTMSEDYELAAHAMKHWASGFLLKKSAGAELIKAIREILKRKLLRNAKSSPAASGRICARSAPGPVASPYASPAGDIAVTG